jgi:hypothetical protein
MADYPFKINIQTKNGSKFSYFTASFATDATGALSSSAVSDKLLHSGLRAVQYTESIDAPADNVSANGFGHSGGGGIYLSSSFSHPNTGSITFTDTETTTNGGLDHYIFYGTKVCSVLGLPEGIKIRPENFKFSDDDNNPDNYLSGDLISNSLQLKQGFKLAPQARVKSNLVWDDINGEGFIQWVSGSTRRAFMGYDETKDLYSLLVSQITGSAIKATTFTGALAGNATTSTTATNLNNGSVMLGEGEVIQSSPQTNFEEPGEPLILSASKNDLGNGGDIILQAGHNHGGASTAGFGVRGGHVIVRPGRTNFMHGSGFTELAGSPGTRTPGSFIVSGSTVFTGTHTNDSQPAFLALNSGTDNNLATNTLVKIEFNSEVYDQASNYDNGTDTFTAPVTGKYLLTTTVRLDQIDYTCSWISIRIVTSNREYRRFIDPNFTADLNQFGMSMTTIADMDASDTAHVEFKQSGGTAQVDVNSGNPSESPPQLDTFFSGYLLG